MTHNVNRETFHDEYIKMIIAPMYVKKRNEAEMIFATLYAKSIVEKLSISARRAHPPSRGMTGRRLKMPNRRFADASGG